MTNVSAKLMNISRKHWI